MAGVLALVEGKDEEEKETNKNVESVERGLVGSFAVGFVLVPRGAGAKKHEARMMHYGDRRY